jgi:hypothetical protein
MSLLSENVATVMSCEYLRTENIYTDELVANSVITNTITTNSVTLVDPNDPTKTSTLSENGTTLEITATNVQIQGDLTVTGDLNLNNPLYKTELVVINTPGLQQRLTFTKGLLTLYQTVP